MIPRYRYQVTKTWNVMAAGPAEAINEAQKCYATETRVTLMPDDPGDISIEKNTDQAHTNRDSSHAPVTDHTYKHSGPGAYHGTSCIDTSAGPMCGRPLSEHAL